jgi:hypothetical protein
MKPLYVVLFLCPAVSDIRITTGILQLFEEVLGLKTNISKSSVSPIQCSSDKIEVVQEHLPCHVEHFPVKYLGLPLSVKRLTKPQLQSFIDRIADLLLGWKADLMTRAGRVIHVQFVIIATIIYQAMAIDLPRWMLKAIDKIERNYLWRGRKEAMSGHCLVAWSTVTKSKEMGGLGITDLKTLGKALRVRWMWLKKTELEKPWASLLLQFNPCGEALFYMAVTTNVGDGTNSLFWKDRWISGQRVQDFASLIFSMVPKRLVNKRTVQEAM